MWPSKFKFGIRNLINSLWRVERSETVGSVYNPKYSVSCHETVRTREYLDFFFLITLHIVIYSTFGTVREDIRTTALLLSLQCKQGYIKFFLSAR